MDVDEEFYVRYPRIQIISKQNNMNWLDDDDENHNGLYENQIEKNKIQLFDHQSHRYHQQIIHWTS